MNEQQESKTPRTVALDKTIANRIADSADTDIRLMEGAYDEMFGHAKLLEVESGKEKDRRCYYQGIVYSLLTALDRWTGRSVRNGSGLLSGTLEQPSKDCECGIAEVDAKITRLETELGEAKEALRKAEQADWTASLCDRVNEFLREHPAATGEAKNGEQCSVAIQMLHGYAGSLLSERDQLRRENEQLQKDLAHAVDMSAQADVSNQQLRADKERLQVQRDQVLHILSGGTLTVEQVEASGLGKGILIEQAHHEFMRCKAEGRLTKFADLVWESRWGDSPDADKAFATAAEVRSKNFKTIDAYSQAQSAQNQG